MKSKQTNINPADFSSRLIAWQKIHGRHDLPWQNTQDPYAIWVSEIMLQQTQVAAVIGYYAKFMARFPDIASLASATQEEVLQHWSGLGYYSRARNLWMNMMDNFRKTLSKSKHFLALVDQLPQRLPLSLFNKTKPFWMAM
jgi:adenine-specific DNA glycosylase